MSLRGRYYRLRERLELWTAYKLPVRIVHWSAVRLIAHACQGPYRDTVVPELAAMDALKRWEDDLIPELAAMDALKRWEDDLMPTKQKAPKPPKRTRPRAKLRRKGKTKN